MFNRSLVVQTINNNQQNPTKRAFQGWISKDLWNKHQSIPTLLFPYTSFQCQSFFSFFPAPLILNQVVGLTSGSSFRPSRCVPPLGWLIRRWPQHSPSQPTHQVPWDGNETINKTGSQMTPTVRPPQTKSQWIHVLCIFWRWWDVYILDRSLVRYAESSPVLGSLKGMRQPKERYICFLSMECWHVETLYSKSQHSRQPIQGKHWQHARTPRTCKQGAGWTVWVSWAFAQLQRWMKHSWRSLQSFKYRTSSWFIHNNVWFWVYGPGFQTEFSKPFAHFPNSEGNHRIFDATAATHPQIQRTPLGKCVSIFHVSWPFKKLKSWWHSLRMSSICMYIKYVKSISFFSDSDIFNIFHSIFLCLPPPPVRWPFM